MSNNQQKYILPITLKYADKIDLAEKLLKFYTNMVTTLSKREIDILTMIFVFDVNSDDFRDKVRMKKGYNSENSVNVALSRLKDKGILIPHPVINRKDLRADLNKLREMVQKEEATILMKFKK